jgi:catechol 2,3-dioxygenase-like lactoylglutathione lyase family enzyme
MARRDHLGRLIDHVHLVVRDLAASKRFYTAALAALGRELTYEGDEAFACDELFVSSAREVGPSSTAPHRVHVAFQARDREAVGRFHAAGLAAGGRDNGVPGPRRYHPTYYSAFLLDPDGNNVEAVHHGRGRRSVASVEIDLGGEG